MSNRRVSEDYKQSCMSCQHYRLKILMGISFDNEYRADGICECQDNGFYYTCGKFICDDYKEVSK